MSPKDLGQMAIGALIGGGASMFGGGKSEGKTAAPKKPEATSAPERAPGLFGSLGGFTQPSAPGKTLLGQ